MLLFLLINFIIACIGFGSGTVFLGYIYDAYSQFTSVSIESLQIATGISMVLPAPFSPKMLGLIAFQEYGFWFVWPALIAFTLPTLAIVNLTFVNYNQLKDSNFFKQLSQYFPPIMGGITLNIIIVLIIDNIHVQSDLWLICVPTLITMFIRYRLKIDNTGILLVVSAISVALTTFVI